MVTLIATGLEADSKSKSRKNEPNFFITEPPMWESEELSAQLSAIDEEPVVEFADTNVEIETNDPFESSAIEELEEITPFDDKEYTRETDSAENEEITEEKSEPQIDYNTQHENRFASIKNSDSSYPQSEFFEKSDPTLYNGSNLDIPSFMRKKKNSNKNEEPKLF